MAIHVEHTDMTPSLQSALAESARILAESGADAPRLAAELLLALTLGCSRGDLVKQLIMQPGQPLDPASLRRMESYVARRAAGEPVAYITGRKEFYGRNFLVGPDVLIPRPETELLIDLALRHASPQHLAETPFFADFGSGSGCVGITLALELPGWRGLCLEKCGGALGYTRANASRLKAERLGIIRADFSQAPLHDGCLSLLVSNPPYVSENEYAGLSREVLREPKSALVPEADSASGLEAPLQVIAQAQRLLAPKGLLLMEIGCSQGQPLLAALRKDMWQDASIEPDLAGLDRVVTAVRA